MLLRLNTGFKLVPEGERKLEIVQAMCVPSGKPSKAEIKFMDSEGGTISSTYNFDNDKGMFIFSLIVQKALGLGDNDEFNTDDIENLVGKKILCEVVHTEGTKPNQSGELPKFANIKRIISLVEEEETTNVTPRQQVASVNKYDI